MRRNVRTVKPFRMKKIILLACCALAAPLVWSQTKDYKIGVRVSPNLSWIKPDTKFITNDGGVVRFGFGLVTDIQFTDNYAIGTGLNVFQTGGKLSYYRLTNEDGFETVSTMNRTYRLQYGEIPLTLKLRTNEVGYITYWGQFGLGLGVNIRAKSNDVIEYRHVRSETNPDASNFPWQESTRPNRIVEDEDIKDHISLFRASLIIGAGIEYSMAGRTALLIGVTFNNGFTDALRNNSLQSDDSNRVVWEGSGTARGPVPTKLKGMTNFLELNLGVMF